MNLNYQQKPETRQEQSMKLEPRTLLSLKAKLRHGPLAEPARGLEGMLAAHMLLKSKRSVGILIGGLSELVWNRNTTDADAAKHKDVDVAVLTPDFKLGNPFEAGIDWWLPSIRKMNLKSSAGTIEENIEVKFFKNGLDVILNFVPSLHRLANIEPGLYIPNSNFVVSMRVMELLVQADPRTEIPESAQRDLKDEVARKINHTLPLFIAEKFYGYILSDSYDPTFKHNHIITAQEAVQLEPIVREAKAVLEKG